MLKLNCFNKSVGGYSRAGGDRGCVAGLSVVWCARSGCGRCTVFPVGRCRTARRVLHDNDDTNFSTVCHYRR